MSELYAVYMFKGVMEFIAFMMDLPEASRPKFLHLDINIKAKDGEGKMVLFDALVLDRIALIPARCGLKVPVAQKFTVTEELKKAGFQILDGWVMLRAAK